MNAPERIVEQSQFLERLRDCICRAPRLLDIPGYEGLYAVSDEGLVWGHERRWSTGNGGRIARHRPARWLKLLMPNSGYFAVNLKNGGRAKTFSVHRLVALAFIPNPDRLPDVNHLNLRKTDNRAVNLEWISKGDNKRHSARARRRYGAFINLRTNLAAANDGTTA